MLLLLILIATVLVKIKWNEKQDLHSMRSINCNVLFIQVLDTRMKKPANWAQQTNITNGNQPTRWYWFDNSRFVFDWINIFVDIRKKTGVKNPLTTITMNVDLRDAPPDEPFTMPHVLELISVSHSGPIVPNRPSLWSRMTSYTPSGLILKDVSFEVMLTNTSPPTNLLFNSCFIFRFFLENSWPF